MLENPMVTGTTYRIEAPGASCRCGRCKAPMYPREYLYNRDGTHICIECVAYYKAKMSDEEFAEKMDWDEEEVE